MSPSDSENRAQAAMDDFWRRVRSGPYWKRITSGAAAGRLKDDVARLVKRYRGTPTKCFVLIDVTRALDFLSDLEALNIAVMGCDHYEYRSLSSPVDEGRLVEVDGRYYAPYPGIRANPAGAPEYLTEILDGGSYVGDGVLLAADPVEPSIRLTRDHIQTSLPPGVEFVDIGLVIPDDWLGTTLLYS